MRLETLALDDRREIWRLMARLTPAQRVRFLTRELARAHPGGEVEATNFTGTAAEACLDLMALEVLHRVGIEDMAVRLERFVRKGV